MINRLLLFVTNIKKKFKIRRLGSMINVMSQNKTKKEKSEIMPTFEFKKVKILSYNDTMRSLSSATKKAMSIFKDNKD